MELEEGRKNIVLLVATKKRIAGEVVGGVNEGRRGQGYNSLEWKLEFGCQQETHCTCTMDPWVRGDTQK